MKRLAIKSLEYREILKNYEGWLKSLGYPKETIESFPLHVREFFHWLEGKPCLSIRNIKESYTEEYKAYLRRRKNEKRGGGLSSHSLNKHYVAINNMMSYLHEHNRELLLLHFEKEEVESNPKVLTKKEVQLLYEASYERERIGSYYIGQRDRVILGIYYGCGLRLNEGVSLDVSDVDFSNQVLRVRKGKNQKEREVPIPVKCLSDLKSYLEEARDWYCYTHWTNNPNQWKEKADREALLLSAYGSRLSKSSVNMRLKKLRERSGIEKIFSPHSLRHSVATHLLSEGMDLDRIKQFLGHASLESTQIYTHLTSEELLDH